MACCVLELEPELADRFSLHEISTDVAQFHTTYTNNLINKLADYFAPFEAFVALYEEDIS